MTVPRTPADRTASALRPAQSTASRFRGLGLVLAMSALGAGSFGCSKALIPNTDVTDSHDNRRIVAFCEKYRRAIEERDVDTLLSITSKRYFETGGTAKPSDDMDYEGLKAYLAGKFKGTKAVRYEIRYRHIGETESKIVQVDFTFTASFQIPTEKGDVWHRAVRDNRLQLIRDDKNESFLILSGM